MVYVIDDNTHKLGRADAQLPPKAYAPHPENNRMPITRVDPGVAGITIIDPKTDHVVGTFPDAAAAIDGWNNYVKAAS